MGTMTALLAALTLAFAGPFWEELPPAEWSDVQVAQLLSDSPWAQMAPGPPGRVPFPPVQAFLATAGPVRMAEQERDRRRGVRQQAGDPHADEYRLWLEEFAETQIILAVRVESMEPYYEAEELAKLEESEMRFGRRKVALTGYFPPADSDPYLRLAFPRVVEASDGKLGFDLYIPGVTGSYRQLEFELDRMVVDGKLEL